MKTIQLVMVLSLFSISTFARNQVLISCDLGEGRGFQVIEESSISESKEIKLIDLADNSVMITLEKGTTYKDQTATDLDEGTLELMEFLRVDQSMVDYIRVAQVNRNLNLVAFVNARGAAVKTVALGTMSMPVVCQ